MSEALFYHLERRALEDVLPGLVERTLERGWRALIRAESAERAEAIDNLLWTYDDSSFLPHAQAGDGDSARQKVLISVEAGNPNAADVLFLVGGAETDWNERFTRVVTMFDGRDETMLAKARAAWKAAKSSGLDVTYWKEMPGGKFEKQA
ncbi:MAG TPA: DNA polymerase III subunit chi [Rhizomicrobium sp.]|nr:DNA polymerase III subunit chi [Rhizomicrobium sp.]